MQSVTDRFLAFYEYLKTKNLVKNARELAENIKVTSSMMTEITKKRTEVGVKVLQNTVNFYRELVNPIWLLTGNGEMLLRETSDLTECSKCREKDLIIAGLEGEIKILKELLNDANRSKRRSA